MSAPEAESDIEPITHSPTDVVLHIKEETKDLQNNKDAAFYTPLSPVNHSPPSPVMEIIPPPLSHRLRVTTPPESATAVVLSKTDSRSTDSRFTQELQSSSEMQHTPLTESQIDDAKNLVLDLLGWGVDPEYLVTSGVHPELIYRIFTDLNLRLPTNLKLFVDGQSSQ